VLNVGVVRGGRGVNVIADEARCEIDLRAERLERLAALEERARAIFTAPAPAGLRLEVEELGRRPGGATPEAHPLVRAARAAWELSGVPPQLVAASTEANAALARGVAALGFGVATIEGTHTPDESLTIESLESGARALARLVFELAGAQ
jgi:acetylornithine deacetylase/succinyl-diaminopimelate desuccinylase-like protein